MKYFYGSILVVAFMLAIEPAGVAQCAMCRTALENSVEGQAIAEGLAKGIVFLLAAPYAVMGGVGYGVFRALRKKKGEPTDTSE